MTPSLQWEPNSVCDCCFNVDVLDDHWTHVPSFLLPYAVVQIPPAAVLSYRNAMRVEDEDYSSVGFESNIGGSFLGGTFIERVPVHRI
jgi:hypothetical protein